MPKIIANGYKERCISYSSECLFENLKHQSSENVSENCAASKGEYKEWFFGLKFTEYLIE